MTRLVQLIKLIDASPIALASLALVLAALAHLGVRAWLRGRARREEAAAGPDAGAAGDPGTTRRARRWWARGLRHIVPPLAAIVWIHGLYAFATLVLTHPAAASIAGQARTGLDWIYRVAIVAALAWVFSRGGRILEGLLVELAARADTSWDDVMLPLAGKAIRRTLPLLALTLGAPALAVSPALTEIVRSGTSLLLIGVIAFVLFQAVDAAAALLLKPHRLDVRDNLQARAIHTQVLVLKKVAVTVIGVFTLACMLMVFDSVRQFGASILASAGIAGIIVGFAAQRSIATLLAGFQIALTQPIRVDDVVIVEGEWGRVEEITLTYVVVRIWDLRRLVLPISYFIEQPFQNWTRSSADLLGSVFLHVDYAVPLAALRDELTRILRASDRWDGKVNGLQVTEAGERTITVRALASAADASLAWDLRCEIREKLVEFLQRHYPDSLPRLRHAAV